MLTIKKEGGRTELQQRKQRVLEAVVESYIASGEPVGSKTVQTEAAIDASSATIRNDMAELTAAGLLYQPHTSAGRAPTVSGYRYYIDNIMKEKPPSGRVRDYIDRRLSSCADSPEKILSAAANALSELTGLAGVATTPPGGDARVHRVRIVQTGRHTAMAVVVTSTGMVKSTLFRCSFIVTPEIVSMFEAALNKSLAGVPLSELNQPFMQTLAASFKELSLFLPEVLSAIMEIAAQAQHTELCISGQTKLLFLPQSEAACARGIISFLADSGAVARLLLSQSRDTRVILGADGSRFEPELCAAVTSRYSISSASAGAIALFGPLRMNYASVLGAVNYTAQAVGELIDELIDI